jgi:hypothetical protein
MKSTQKLILTIGILIGFFALFLFIILNNYYQKNDKEFIFYPNSVVTGGVIGISMVKGECTNFNCSSNTLYIGSKKTKKYYDCFCGWAKTISSRNIVCLESDSQAIALNYTKGMC